MLPKLQNKNFSWKSLTTLFLIVCYWFYLNICFGYFLSKIFYNFFDSTDKTNLSKSIKFRKKFNLENLKKFVISYILKFFENWIKRIGEKCLLVLEAIDQVIKILKIFRKKVKSILKFKYNFRLLKNLLPIFWEALQIVGSLVNEVFFVHSIIKFVIKWKQFLLLLMSKSVLITRVVYVLYLILLRLFSVLLGFLLGVHRRKDDIYVFTLLFLLEMLYNNGLDYVLLEPNKAEQFSKFSLKTIEQINPRPSRIILKEPDQIPLPFLIIEDPLVFIETEVLWEEPIYYKFELFKFYQNVNEKVKY